MLVKNNNFDEKVHTASIVLQDRARDLPIHYWTSLHLQPIELNEVANPQADHNVVVPKIKVEVFGQKK